MKWKQMQLLPEEVFRRLTSVKRARFEKMVELNQPQAQTVKKRQGGRPNKLIVQEMVLMTLEYLREYRTYLHITCGVKNAYFFNKVT